MTAIRGRLGQYKVLSQQQELIPYIVPTVYFTKNSLHKMLNQHDGIMIKPIVGRNFIKIEKRTNGFVAKLNEQQHFLSNTESIIDFMQQSLPNQHTVIQPIISSNRCWKKPYYLQLTLRKKGTNWAVTHIKNNRWNTFSRFLFFYNYIKIRKIALLTATTLASAYPLCEAIVMNISSNLVGNFHIHDSYLHFSVSKWGQYQSLQPYMPKTELLTQSSLLAFLQTYETVFIKPCNGQHGKGIVKITRNLDNSYEIQLGRTNWQWNGVFQCMSHLQQLLSSEKDYVIQQGIPLAKIRSSVFDVRVLLQRIYNKWQVIGKAVKVAGDGFFITNAAQAILPFDEALQQSSVAVIHQEGMEERIDQLCLRAVKALNPAHYEIGFDVGVTDEGEVQIIEGNYRSDVSIFHQLEDQSFYKTILKNRRLVNQPSE